MARGLREAAGQPPTTLCPKSGVDARAARACPIPIEQGHPPRRTASWFWSTTSAVLPISRVEGGGAFTHFACCLERLRCS